MTDDLAQIRDLLARRWRASLERRHPGTIWTITDRHRPEASVPEEEDTP